MNYPKNDLLPLNIQMFASPGDDDFDEIDIDDLFKDPEATPASDPSSKLPENLTLAMTKRINEVKAKTEKEAQDKVAKELGYDSYAEMKKAQEADLLRKHGYNPEDLEEVIEPLLQKRLADDPRFKQLEALQAREREAYIAAQLAAINETTGQQLKMADLPQATLDLWAKGIELEQAYYATHGKTIITKGVNKENNGSMGHLANGSGAGHVKTRRLTEEEKALYRTINPYITEEELSKKTTPVANK